MKKRIAFTIIPWILVMFLAEGSCRIYDAVKNKTGRERAVKCAELRQINHPFLYYAFVPGQRTNCASINSRGFRGAEFSSRRAKDAFRIIVIGGSVVFDAFENDESQIFTKVLQNFLNKNRPRTGRFKRFEVINMGAPSYNSTQELFLAETYVTDFESDMVISFSGYNDFGYRFQSEWKPYFPLTYNVNPRNLNQIFDAHVLLKRLSGGSSFFRKLFAMIQSRALRIQRERQRDAAKLKDEEMNANSARIWLKNEKNMFVLLGNENKIFVTVLQPSFFASGKRRHKAQKKLFDSYVQQYGDQINMVANRYVLTARAAGKESAKGKLRFLNYSSMENDGDVFLDQCHLTRHGKRIVTERLGNDILAIMSREGLL